MTDAVPFLFLGVDEMLPPPPAAALESPRGHPETAKTAPRTTATRKSAHPVSTQPEGLPKTAPKPRQDFAKELFDEVFAQIANPSPR